MNKYACYYAIVQFMPYPETGEFANVGVIMAIPQLNVFAYRLEKTKAKRICDFFNHLDRKVYLEGIKALNEELAFYEEAVKGRQITAQAAFDSLARPLETILRFSPERVRMIKDKDGMIDILFQRYVMHEFAKAPDYELQLQRKVAQIVRSVKVKNRFRKKLLGQQGIFKVTMPMVQENEGFTRAIHPLFFNQKEPQKIIEHGNLWEGKLGTLETLKALPRDILIPYEMPDQKQQEQYMAWKLVSHKLEKFGKLIPANDVEVITDFAKSENH
ncbi:DUF3037 domain-containing protein [Sansalvadorimonas sp. 2012CJ34-2]|uniref:DUF3037 domain-containing protein n=1 Tax=Parendozoicomonas callyspongiae TaxID=2942213 RepID=A0ABT0PLJ6_9GAMM|nr:DUF3037 domain-containing protein [Sansalvadorimonas sp. 2012CJ34-2]MCL6271318.1 DUF3037 domain-containing protein [Sansalvadorimonas sp. 2012CJ34-2]